MKTICKDIRLSQDTISREYTITLTTKHNVIQDIRQMQEIVKVGKELVAEIKEYKFKRSLAANAYAWELIGKLADVLRTSKDELYIEMLKRYGQREKDFISVISEAVGTVFRALDNHCCVIGESELNGKTFKHLAILIGSSQYDTRQMSILIDGIVDECKEQGIETMTPAEIQTLKNDWRK